MSASSPTAPAYPEKLERMVENAESFLFLDSPFFAFPRFFRHLDVPNGSAPGTDQMVMMRTGELIQRHVVTERELGHIPGDLQELDFPIHRRLIETAWSGSETSLHIRNRKRGRGRFQRAQKRLTGRGSAKTLRLQFINYPFRCIHTIILMQLSCICQDERLAEYAVESLYCPYTRER